jgi:hypothetical protein
MELKPWTETWNDELNSAVEVGAEGEDKVVQRLWPEPVNETKKKHPNSRPCTSTSPRAKDAPTLLSDPQHVARSQEEASAAGTVKIIKPGESVSPASEMTRRFPNSKVLYLDARNAVLLKPSLWPSAAFGRRPLSKIRKGNSVGIPVVRGFSWGTWETLHPLTKNQVIIKTDERHIIGLPGNANQDRRKVCPACLAREQRPKVSDLVLVIHGLVSSLNVAIAQVLQ